MIPNLIFTDEGPVVEVKTFSKSDTQYDFSDPRVVFKTHDNHKSIIGLTSLSHQRLAWSDDGIHFEVEKVPWLFPATPEEAWGCEDARITKIDETYWINYTAVSDLGIATALASTNNFVDIERQGIIFSPPNRDVVIFPEKIDGKYVAFHRPMPTNLGSQNIWYADSPDLVRWGNHKVVASPRPGLWDGQKIGGGAPPILTAEGWLSIYHGVDKDERYSLGALLTDRNEPWKVIGRSQSPLLEPEAPYEQVGLFPNVCFTCGAIQRQDELWLYYGAADKVLALGIAKIQDILQSLTAV